MVDYKRPNILDGDSFGGCRPHITCDLQDMMNMKRSLADSMQSRIKKLRSTCSTCSSPRTP